MFRWDEWVPESRLVRMDPDGIVLAQKLRSKYSHVITEKPDCGPETVAHESNSSSTYGIKEHGTKAVTVSLGANCKRVLFSDWESIAKRQCLYNLPLEMTVDKILQMFLDSQPPDRYTQQQLS